MSPAAAHYKKTPQLIFDDQNVSKKKEKGSHEIYLIFNIDVKTIRIMWEIWVEKKYRNT